MERGWGKPPQFLPLEQDDPLGLSEETLDEVARELDAAVRRIAETDGRADTPPSYCTTTL